MASAHPPHQTILLYEDDGALAGEIALAFAGAGHALSLARSQDDILRAPRAADPPLLILDRMVHGHDSLALIERLRAAESRIPIMVISSMGSIDERIRCLRAGGDDYLPKPFSLDELVARVEALMRRAAPARETRLVCGSLSLDLIDRRVRRHDRDITLLPKEFTLLEFFMRQPGQVVTRAMILEKVWNYTMPVDTNVVDVHFGNLRRKVDGEGERPLLSNRRGVGFVLSPDDGAIRP